MNDLITFFEVAVLAHCFITTCSMHDDYQRLRKEHDKMMDNMNLLQNELDCLYRMLSRLQEDQKNEQ